MQDKDSKKGLVAFVVSILLVSSIIIMIITANLKTDNIILFIIGGIASIFTTIHSFKARYKYYQYASFMISLGFLIIIFYNLFS
ncbi:hypothetical protein BAMA_20540 [Bacillus manliponensis]|uniref:DUF3953 domain-containing protein n=1 Tax=Bacillus manliponensis TaxID=574376 RepID=A0A073JZM0_9BACI|nr:hypothetical protein [Bacillus manliponensis]KEK19652.1 hypothetical protein BAMA_20540 [Bacillus manliponensis]